MAIVRPGPLVQAISGSLGSLVFSNARASLVVRNRPLKINQLSKYQIAQRGKYSFVVASWKTLTTLQKTGWKNLAGQVPTVNALGQRRPLSSFQLFVKFNLLIPDPESNLIDDPPLAIVTPPPASITWEPHEIAPYYLSASFTTYWLDSYILIYGARTFQTNAPKFISNYRHLTTCLPFPKPFDIHDTWDAKLGPLKETEICAVKVRYWKPDRLPSPPTLTVSTVDAEGFYPLNAHWFPGLSSCRCFFNMNVDPGFIDVTEFYLDVGGRRWEFTHYSVNQNELLLYNGADIGAGQADGLSYTKGTGHLKSTTGEICQTFHFLPFTTI